MSNEEIWLPVVGYESSHEVSSLGRIRSIDRHAWTSPSARMPRGFWRILKGKLLKGTRSASHKYVTVGLRHGDPTLLHQHVLRAFRGPCPPGHESLHGNGDRGDNRLSNLRWGTRSDNVQDALKHGRIRSRKGIPRGQKLQPLSEHEGIPG